MITIIVFLTIFLCSWLACYMVSNDWVEALLVSIAAALVAIMVY